MSFNNFKISNLTELVGKKNDKYFKSLRAEGENTDALEGSYLDPRAKNKVGPGDIIRNRLHDLSKIFGELFQGKPYPHRFWTCQSCESTEGFEFRTSSHACDFPS